MNLFKPFQPHIIEPTFKYRVSSAIQAPFKTLYLYFKYGFSWNAAKWLATSPNTLYIYERALKENNVDMADMVCDFLPSPAMRDE